MKRIKSFVCIKEVVDNYIKYYNNEQFQYEMAKISSNKYIKYYRTGIYLLKNAIEEMEQARKIDIESLDPEKLREMQEKSRRILAALRGLLAD